jgi:hypothetical protein
MVIAALQWHFPFTMTSPSSSGSTPDVKYLTRHQPCDADSSLTQNSHSANKSNTKKSFKMCRKWNCQPNPTLKKLLALCVSVNFKCFALSRAAYFREYFSRFRFQLLCFSFFKSPTLEMARNGERNSKGKTYQSCVCHWTLLETPEKLTKLSHSIKLQFNCLSLKKGSKDIVKAFTLDCAISLHAILLLRHKNSTAKKEVKNEMKLKA